MEFTPQQRLEMYEGILPIIKDKDWEYKSNGLCMAIAKVCDNLKVLSGHFYPISVRLPELIIARTEVGYKYNVASSYWFPLNKRGLNKRIKLMNIAIKKIKSKHAI